MWREVAIVPLDPPPPPPRPPPPLPILPPHVYQANFVPVAVVYFGFTLNFADKPDLKYQISLVIDVKGLSIGKPILSRRQFGNNGSSSFGLDVSSNGEIDVTQIDYWCGHRNFQSSGEDLFWFTDYLNEC